MIWDRLYAKISSFYNKTDQKIKKSFDKVNQSLNKSFNKVNDALDFYNTKEAFKIYASNIKRAESYKDLGKNVEKFLKDTPNAKNMSSYELKNEFFKYFRNDVDMGYFECEAGYNMMLYGKTQKKTKEVEEVKPEKKAKKAAPAGQPQVTPEQMKKIEKLNQQYKKPLQAYNEALREIIKN